MEDWYKGDIAICINAGALKKADEEYFKNNPTAIIVGAEYVVRNTYHCPECKGTALDIGIYNTGGPVQCACKRDMPFKDVRWFTERRFKKKIVPVKVDIMLD